MGDPLDFSELGSLLATCDLSLEVALSSPQIRIAFKRQFSRLIGFLNSNLRELTRIAIGRASTTSREVVAAAFYCLTNLAPLFSNPLATNRIFLADLFTALPDTEPASEYNLLAFSRIFHFIVQLSNGFVFLNIPDKAQFINHLIALLDHSSIFELISNLTTNISQPVMTFLESVSASTVFMNSLSDDILLNSRILQLLSYLFTTNLPSETLLKPLAEENMLERLFGFVLGSPVDAISALSAQLLSAICDLDFNCSRSAARWLVQRVPSFCDYVVRSRLYTPSTSCCVRLMLRLFRDMGKRIPECVLNMAKFMFDSLFVHSGHTFLQHDFLAVVAAVGINRELVGRCGMAHRIANAFRQYHKTGATYWACLHSLTRSILRAKCVVDGSDGWKTYIHGEYLKMERLMTADYGGKTAEEEGTSSYEYEYEESSESYDSDD
jgi:hypothetical protein